MSEFLDTASGKKYELVMLGGIDSNSNVQPITVVSDSSGYWRMLVTTS
jgi:hypothetical protein